MSIVVEELKTGRPTILLNKNKYREAYTFKSGEIVWRCLGRNCAATVRTDANKTKVIVANNKHSGPHPVTMRSLSSSPVTPVSTATSTTTVSHQAATTPATAPSTNIASPSDYTPESNSTVIEYCTPKANSPSPISSPVPPINTGTTVAVSSPPSLQDLQLENNYLKSQVSELKQQVKTLLDHAIESDSRLLEYTNDVFVTKTPCTKVNNNFETVTPKRLSSCENGVQCDLQSTMCRDCEGAHDLITSLRTTIEVLESEVQCLRAEKNDPVNSVDNWLLYHGKKTPPIPIQNRFSNLQVDASDNESDGRSLPKHFNILTKPKTRPKSSFTIHPKSRTKEFPKFVRSPTDLQHNKKNERTPTAFSSLLIEGDSHARHLATLLQEKINLKTTVSGMCKPSAKLRSVSSGNPPPPGSCTVIIAGTNDVATGESCNIFRHLEEIIKSRLTPASAVIVSTLPVRHDLPAGHPVHQQTAVVNNYIKELCARLKQVQLMDFNFIQRRFFTRHGMHLRAAGKRLLAGLVMESLLRIGASTAPVNTLPSSARTLSSSEIAQTTSSSEPICLPYDSFAEAVRGPTLHSKNSLVKAKLKSR